MRKIFNDNNLVFLLCAHYKSQANRASKSIQPIKKVDPSSFN